LRPEGRPDTRSSFLLSAENYRLRTPLYQGYSLESGVS
jgi:hypothetical protein